MPAEAHGSTREAAEQAENDLIFICGGAANESEVWPFCSRLIWLKTDDATIRTRVGHKRDHDYGSKPHELTLIMQANTIKEVEYRRLGAIIIDARQPIADVTKAIIAAINI